MQKASVRLKSALQLVRPSVDASIGEHELKPISPTLLYRRLLKLYIRKFDTDTNTIVRAWKQTKYEFWLSRNATTETADLYNIKGQQVLEAIRAGLVPIYHNSKMNQTYYKYDSDTLKAVHNHVDPVSPEEFLRRFHKYMDARDVDEIRSTLKKLGRWSGPDELSDGDVYRVKTSRKTRCTDPD